MNADKNLDAPGQACINLTPLIKQAMTSVEPGGILKVYSDDVASRLGVPAWCRLTGNSLVEVEEIDSAQTAFYIKKKNS